MSEAGFKDWTENSYKRKKYAKIRGNTQANTPIKNPKQKHPKQNPLQRQEDNPLRKKSGSGNLRYQPAVTTDYIKIR